MPENDNRTRRELEAALRGLLGQKPLGQLRVRELTERCGLRRQSFYYHFTDIYDLFAWCLSRERALLLDRLEDCLTWRQAFLALLNRVSEERAFYRAALDRCGQAGLGELVPLEEVLQTVQVYYRNRCGVQPDRAEEERDRRCGRLLLLALLESWLRGGEAMPPEELADALERAAERSAAGAVWHTLRERGEWNGVG
ncbi:MAG: TetR family transcriptional regulator [Oscillibacter sp.]|nr:TetR family transcriptional regulator [Oscillibacter sp.]